MEGVRYTEKGVTIFDDDNHRDPTGDTIEFSERAPLQVRKDALAIAVYILTLEAAKPMIDTGGGPA